MEIITWCNVNQGFATIILSIFTLIISVIAIVVSIKTAQFPFKKKLGINVVFDELNENEYQCKLYVMNTGNRIIVIFGIWLESGENFLCNTEESIKYIEPSKVVEYVFVFNQNKIQEPDNKIKIRILDTEQEEHVFENDVAMG